MACSACFRSEAQLRRTMVSKEFPHAIRAFLEGGGGSLTARAPPLQRGSRDGFIARMKARELRRGDAQDEAD